MTETALERAGLVRHRLLDQGWAADFARAALAHGFRLVATARDPQSIADLVEGKDGQAIALKLDVADPDAIEAAVHEAERAFGRIDVLIDDAGTATWRRSRRARTRRSAPSSRPISSVWRR